MKVYLMWEYDSFTRQDELVGIHLDPQVADEWELEDHMRRCVTTEELQGYFDDNDD